MDPKSERNSNFKTSSNLTTYTNYLTAPENPMYPTPGDAEARLDEFFVTPKISQSLIFVGGINLCELHFLKEIGSANEWSPHIYCTPGEDPVFQSRYVVAPATRVPTLFFDEKEGEIVEKAVDGTSVATPLVSVACSLLLESYNNELVDLYQRTFPPQESFVSCLKGFNVQEVEGSEKKDYDMALSYIFQALRTSSSLTNISDIKEFVFDDALLRIFKTRRSRFVTKLIFEGARKHALFDENRLLDPEIYGQGVVDAQRSQEILKEIFESEEAVEYLMTYETPPLSEEDYNEFLGRQNQRLQNWKEVYHPEMESIL